MIENSDFLLLAQNKLKQNHDKCFLQRSQDIFSMKINTHHIHRTHAPPIESKNCQINNFFTQIS